MSATPFLVVLASWLALAGYLLGLRRFRAQLRRSATTRLVHTVVLDGVSESGKTTLRLRLSYPCSERTQLQLLAATPSPKIHRPLPLCFDPPEQLHVLQFGDAPGEKSEGIDELLRGSDGTPIALWVWDLTRTIEENREVMNRARVRAVYLTTSGKRVERVIVFLNKLDGLDLSDAELAEKLGRARAEILLLVDGVFKPDNVVIHQGSALDGTGVFEVYGAILSAIGLEEQFRSLDVPTRPPEVT